MSKDAEPTSTIHIPTSVWEEIQAIAEETDRSGRWTAIHALKKYIKEERGK